LAKGPRYRVPYRRRREGKTDYAARRIMAISDRPRFVVRPSNKNIVIQIITAKIEGDYVLAQSNSKELKEYGWLGGSKNIPAAYLLGMIAAKKALAKGIDEAILDIGLLRPTKGSRIFSAVKGAIDTGFKIPCDSNIMPNSSSIDGKTISEYADSIENPFLYERQFSGYLKNGLRPQDLPDHVSQIKSKIEEAEI